MAMGFRPTDLDLAKRGPGAEQYYDGNDGGDAASDAAHYQFGQPGDL